LSVFLHAVPLVSLQLFIFAASARSQGLEKALITHSSESISIAPLTYGIEKGLYRKEGVDLQFRILRGDLAISSMVSGKEVDYIYGAGTAFLAAVRGAPVRILSHDFRSVLFYLMAQPSVRSPKDLKGKKIAVSSLGGTGAASARACLRALELDPDKDMTFIVIGAASVRLAAMESGSVEAAIMPVPWNSRMKQKGFKEMKAAREEKRDFVEFIGRKFNLDPRVAEETYQVVLQTLTEDGTVSQQALEDLLEQMEKETGVQREISVQEIVDYRLLREVAWTAGR